MQGCAWMPTCSVVLWLSFSMTKCQASRFPYRAQECPMPHSKSRGRAEADSPSNSAVSQPEKRKRVPLSMQVKDLSDEQCFRRRTEVWQGGQRAPMCALLCAGSWEQTLPRGADRNKMQNTSVGVLLIAESRQENRREKSPYKHKKR